MKLLINIIYFLPFFIFSQSNELTAKPLSILLDSINNQIVYQTSNSINWIDINNLKITKSIINYNDELSKHKSIISKGNLYFLKNNGGDVYNLNSENNFQKIDNSGIHNYFINTRNFVRNDTLFKHGGYGYWTSSNFIIYLDKTTKEWEVYPISKNSDNPRGADSHTSIISSSHYTFFGGYSVSRDGHRGKDNLNNEVWNFDFESKEWKLLGNKYPNQYDGISGGFIDNNQFFFFDKKSKLYAINIIDNTLTEFERNPVLYDFKRIDPICYKGNIYYVNTQGILTKIPLAELTKRVKQVSDFYKKDNNNLVLYSIILGVIFIASIYFSKEYLKRKNKLILLENGIKYRSKFAELSAISISIIRLAYKGDIEYAALYELTKKSHLSKIQNERIKNSLINDINIKTMALTGLKEDFLIISKSSYDARYKIVTLNQSHYKQLL